MKLLPGACQLARGSQPFAERGRRDALGVIGRFGSGSEPAPNFTSRRSAGMSSLAVSEILTDALRPRNRGAIIVANPLRILIKVLPTLFGESSRGACHQSQRQCEPGR